MIDIHCHILPDFDDGAANLKESLTMARMASDSGIHRIVATPHFRGSPESLHSLPKLLATYRQLSRAIRRENIPLELLPGAEILCMPQTVELAKDRALPTLGDSDYLLTEFFFDESGSKINSMLRSLADCGYKIVIAHPERYEAVQRSPRLLEGWFREGYVLQLNKGSILGAFGSQPQRVAELALHHGFAHIVASDAHSSIRRTPSMRRLLLHLREICPPEYLRILVDKNPDRVIRNLDMEPIA